VDGDFSFLVTKLELKCQYNPLTRQRRFLVSAGLNSKKTSHPFCK